MVRRIKIMVSIESKYLFEIIGDKNEMQEFEFFLEELGIVFEKNVSRKMGFMELQEIVTLLITFTGSAGVASLISAFSKRKSVDIDMKLGKFKGENLSKKDYSELMQLFKECLEREHCNESD
jgi:hypothetical protein